MTNLPTFINFSQVKTTCKDEAKQEAWMQRFGYIPFEDALGGFNGSKELQSFFHTIKMQYHLETAIETGVYKAATTKYLSTYFKQVYAIEFNREAYEECKRNLEGFSNVQLILGSSPEILQNLLPKLRDQRLFIYLDAHGFGEWPLLKELDLIAQTHKDNCVVVIDDCKVPGRPDIQYDICQGQECCTEFFQANLSKIFTDYTYHYLIPEHLHKAAKYMAVPKKWSV